MSRVVILGAGVMGTAFSFPLADNGHEVRLVGTHLDGEIIEEIHESGLHPRLPKQLSHQVTPFTYDRLAEAMDGVDLVVIGVNSLGVDWAGEQLKAVLPSAVPILMLTKGLFGDGERLHILPDVLRQWLPPGIRDRVHVLAVGGPSIAGELAVRRHTCVVLSGAPVKPLENVAALLRTPYYHVWTSTDLIGVEVSVALKNLYALAVGVVNGLLESDNTGDNVAMHNVAAAIFAQGLWETAYIVDKMGGQRQSVMSLPGAGDLYVTCQGGRNSRMGRLLGLGIPYRKAKSEYMPDDTIEGAELAQAIGPTINAMVERGELNPMAIPLMRSMIRIVCEDAPVDVPWDAFFDANEPLERI